jgi:hypothetical protein
MVSTTLEPVPARVRGVNQASVGCLKNRRDDRAYLLANPNDDLHGLAFHLDSGWHEIRATKDGDKERINSGRVDANGRVTFQGQVLIWLEKDEHDLRAKDQQALVKAREKKKLAPGGIDGVVDAQGVPATPYHDPK